MKKAIALVLILTMLCTTAYAATVDFSDWSDEQLIALRTIVTQEILNRGLATSAKVPTGDYIVGVDIPAGKFSITSDYPMVTISVGQYGLYLVTPDSPLGKVEFSEGEKVSFSGPVVLTVYTGLSFE